MFLIALHDLYLSQCQVNVFASNGCSPIPINSVALKRLKNYRSMSGHGVFGGNMTHQISINIFCRYADPLTTATFKIHGNKHIYLEIKQKRMYT